MDERAVPLVDHDRMHATIEHVHAIGRINSNASDVAMAIASRQLLPVFGDAKRQFTGTDYKLLSHQVSAVWADPLGAGARARCGRGLLRDPTDGILPLHYRDKRSFQRSDGQCRVTGSSN